MFHAKRGNENISNVREKKLDCRMVAQLKNAALARRFLQTFNQKIKIMSKEVYLRREGLINVVEYFSHMEYNNHKLSEEQRKQLKETRDALYCFGEIGQLWAGLADEILAS